VAGIEEDEEDEVAKTKKIPVLKFRDCENSHLFVCSFRVILT
jgi:hypothetical protein